MSRHRKNILPVDLAPSSDFLVTDRDEPVWPVRSDDEKEALVRVTGLFRADLDPIVGSQGHTRPGSEEVVGLGAAVADCAQLYAHLTRREFRLVTHEADVIRHRPPAVLVTTFSALTPELMQRLYVHAGQNAPGIVCARDKAALRTQVLVRAAAAILKPPDIGRTDIFPSIPVSHVATPEHIVFGRDAQVPELRSALATGTALLTLATHADGIDAYVNSNLTLCAMSRFENGEGRQAAPVCSITNYCHRIHRALPDALRSGLLLFPNEIAARIFVFSACSGVMLAVSPVAGESGIAPQLFDNPSLGAIVTTSELTFVQPIELESLLGDLQKGVQVGRAVARFNGSPIARRHREHLCLFGDPRTRSGPPKQKVRDVEVQAPAKSRDLKIARRIPELAELGFARASLTIAVTSLSAGVKQVGPLNAAGDQRKLKSAVKALNAINVFEHMVWTLDRKDEALELAAKSVREALIEDAHNRGMFINDWFACVRKDKLRWRLRKCICGLSAKTAEVELRIPGVAKRRIGICVRCGVTEDTSLRLALSFGFNQQTGEVHLQTPAPVSEWSAAFQIHSKYRPYCKTWDWPTAADGRPEKVFHSPQPWPIGPLRVSLIMIHRGAISFVNQEIYLASPTFESDVGPR